MLVFVPPSNQLIFNLFYCAFLLRNTISFLDFERRCWHHYVPTLTDTAATSTGEGCDWRGGDGVGGRKERIAEDKELTMKVECSVTRRTTVFSLIGCPL